MRWPLWLRFFVAYAFIFLPLYLPLMGGWVIYSAGDTLGFDYPPLLALQPFSINSLLSDPFSGQGFPWLVTYGTFDPIAHVLRLFFDAYQTLGWLIYIYLVMGSFFFALLLRRHHFSGVTSFLGGLVFTCAFFWTADGDYPLAFSVPLFSSLLFLLSFARSNLWRSSLFAAFMIGYGWLAGHFNYTPLILVGCGVYVCYETWKHRTITPLLVLGSGAVLGTCIGLLKLIPALAYVQLSTRAGGLSVAAASTMTLPLSSLYTAFFPYLRLPLIPGDTGVLFYGAMGLGLALLGVFSGDKRVRPLLLAWILIVIITLPHSPLYAIIQHLPFFSFLRTPYRWMFLAHACVAAFAAIGIDVWMKQEKKMAKRIGISFLLVALGSFLVSIALLLLDLTLREWITNNLITFFDEYLLSKTSGLPLEHYHTYIRDTWMNLVTQWSLLSLRFFLPFLGVLLAGSFFVRRSSRGALIVLTIFTSLAPLFFYHPHTSRTAIDHVRSLYDSSLIDQQVVMPIMPALTDFLVRSTQFGDHEEERVPYQLGLLMPNTQALLGIHSIDFYQPIQTSRMGRLLAALGSDSAPAPDSERLALQNIPLDEKIRTIAKRTKLLSALGVTYVVSAQELPEPFVKVESIRPVSRLPEIGIYSSPTGGGLFSVPFDVRVMRPNEDEMVRILTTESGDAALVECMHCDVLPAENLLSYMGTLKQDPTFVSATVTVNQDAWLKIGRARLPGYRVFVDGNAVKTAIMDGIYPGVLVPVGTHTVDMRITYAWLLEDSLKLLLTKNDPWLL